MSIASRQDPRVERTVTTVLEAAHRLLETEGLESVTFGRISRETGVSRTTLYRHWPTPSALVVDAWARVVPPNEVAQTSDLHHDLVDLFVGVRDVVESAAMRRSLPALLAAAQRDPVISYLHAEFVQSRRRPIVDRLRAAVVEGQIVPDADLELLVDLLSGPIFYRQLIHREITSDADVDAIVRMVLASVRPPA